MRLKGVCRKYKGTNVWQGIAWNDAEIELTAKELAEQLTNDQLAELNHLKWQYEMPGLPKPEPECRCEEPETCPYPHDKTDWCYKCNKPIKPASGKVEPEPEIEELERIKFTIKEENHSSPTAEGLVN